MLGIKAEIQKWETRPIARIIKDYSLLDSAFVAIGWDQYSGKYPSGQSVALVATINEFGSYNSDGSVKTPARPFMRPAYDENRPALNALRKQVVEAVNSGRMTPYKALNVLGYRMQLWIQAKIKANPAPALAARTLARKRAAGRPAVTLIDTRRMLDTLTYKIYLGRFGSGQQSEQAKASQAAAKRISGMTAQKQEAYKQQLAAKVQTAKQIRREKLQLRAELKHAQNQKKRASASTKRVFQAARRGMAAKTKAANRKEMRDYRHQQKAAKVRAKAEVKRAKTMLKRDAREAKGLSRTVRMTPRQKEAKLAREKLQAGNRARLRTERRADQKEARQEKLARQNARKQQIAKKRVARKAAKTKPPAPKGKP